MINFTKKLFHFNIFSVNTSLLWIIKHGFSGSFWTKQDNIGKVFVKVSLINNQTQNIFSNILWTIDYKVQYRYLYMISFQKSITASSNMTLSLIITHHRIHILINKTLRGTIQDSLHDLLSKINQPKLISTYYEPHLSRYCTGLSIVSIINSQPHLFPKEHYLIESHLILSNNLSAMPYQNLYKILKLFLHNNHTYSSNRFLKTGRYWKRLLKG